jgi:hypothetical protein
MHAPTDPGGVVRGPLEEPVTFRGSRSTCLIGFTPTPAGGFAKTGGRGAPSTLLWERFGNPLTTVVVADILGSDAETVAADIRVGGGKPRRSSLRLQLGLGDQTFITDRGFGSMGLLEQQAV